MQATLNAAADYAAGTLTIHGGDDATLSLTVPGPGQSKVVTLTGNLAALEITPQKLQQLEATLSGTVDAGGTTVNLDDVDVEFNRDGQQLWSVSGGASLAIVAGGVTDTLHIVPVSVDGTPQPLLKFGSHGLTELSGTITDTLAYGGGPRVFLGERRQP